MKKNENYMNSTIDSYTDQIVEFTLGTLHIALTLNEVVRVVRAVEITNLPEAPEIITGIINIQGEVIPVVNIRKRLGLAEQVMDPDNKLIIADTGKRQIAVIADIVTGIKTINNDYQTNIKDTLPGLRHLKGIAKTDGEIILIYNLEQFLSLDEEEKLDNALKTVK